MLENVNQKLVDIVEEARNITVLEFDVVEGVRNKATQEVMFKTGVSGSLVSPHQFGMAIATLIYVEGIPQTSSRVYEELATVMKYAAQNLDAGIFWGGAPHISDITKVEVEEMGMLINDYANKCGNERPLIINPGYFELVLD